MEITHDNQKHIWEKEHNDPFVLLQMDNRGPSSGVTKFHSWLNAKNAVKNYTGIEMGCGKGRNSIWINQQGIKMKDIDFSNNAIAEAKKRAQQSNTKNIHFNVHDATVQWPYPDNTFDFGIDCFASTDIDSPSGRVFARDEMKRVLKKGGFLLVYTLSTDDEYHQELIQKNPSKEKNSFTHPTTGKFEKVFDKQELTDFYKDFEWVEEQRVEKEAEFFGKKYHCKHFWLVLKKV